MTKHGSWALLCMTLAFAAPLRAEESESNAKLNRDRAMKAIQRCLVEIDEGTQAAERSYGLQPI
jgi:hypothetical protein